VESIKAFGLDVVSDLCQRLRAGGAPGVHLYTMNQSSAPIAVMRSRAETRRGFAGGPNPHQPSRCINAIGALLWFIVYR